MKSRERSRSNSAPAVNGSSTSSSDSTTSSKNGIKKTENKKRKSTSMGEENGSGKRKSTRLSKLEQNNTPKLSASPLLKENGRIEVISDSEASSISSGSDTKFTEPELAPPAPSYTGLPLEEFPSAKIKKESLWPQKLRRGKGKGTADSSREVSQVPEIDKVKEEKLEELYRSQLQTPITRDITNESEIREPASPTPRATSKITKLKLTVQTPKQPTNKRSNRNTPKSALKKLKITSPKKSPSTKLLAPNTKIKNELHLEEDTHKDNDDFCFACGRPGIFICCESCPKSFHFTCCDPPMEEPPEDDWYCHECFAKRHPQLVPNWKDIGIFGKLLNELEVRNPKEFQLPKNLREQTFVGVYTGENGDYADATEKDDLPSSKRNGQQLSGYNRNEDLEIDSLYDEQGNPYLCHKCGESGQNHRTLIRCDYCPLIYHVDCLPYPMFGPKTIGDKWRCPNHVKDLLPRGLPELREFKETEIVEGSLHSNFLKMLAMESFVVKFDNDEYFRDGSKHQSLDEVEAYSGNGSKLDVLASWGDDMDAIHPNYKTASCFKTKSTRKGVSAKVSTNVVSIPKTSNSSLITYRIPERSILMDFVQKVQSKEDILASNTEYELAKRLEENPEEKEVVTGLNLIKERQKQLNLDALLQVVNTEEQKTTETHKLASDEIDELLKIKKLMELKGQDALLSFLKAS
ncbi:hypothetical protein KGF57_003542 [Candida theae]|uniref:PHD-type domain-containing protein n=1 Tax=Candida theae TaxID=1198502 RepID=A0AAD5BD20_9ASCO|nr:uncharacterized protein KGF57_003542 [Candida theae]KAI5956056.1 hypothetical protein KGF57_003542 [Candida theae]